MIKKLRQKIGNFALRNYGKSFFVFLAHLVLPHTSPPHTYQARSPLMQSALGSTALAIPLGIAVKFSSACGAYEHSKLSTASLVTPLRTFMAYSTVGVKKMGTSWRPRRAAKELRKWVRLGGCAGAKKIP